MIEDLFIRSDFDAAKIVVTFTPPEQCTQIDYEVLDGDIKIANGTIKVSSSVISFEEDLPNFKPWSIESPFLYLFRIKCHVNGKTCEIRQPFGMSKIHVENNKILLNNKPFYLRGYIRGREAHEHPNLMGVSETEYYEKNIKMAKAYGFNFVRFHSVVPPDEFFDAANRLGILCQVEIRKYFPAYQKKEIDDDQTLIDADEWKETVLKLRNHPSLMVYCMGNEINNPGNYPEVKQIYELTKQLDPNKLFLDTCSRGEYDRATADIDVQHMSYFAPFGKNYNMFDDSIHLSIYGSTTGKAMEIKDNEENPTCRIRREVPVNFPLCAHELAHYNVLRDPYKLDEQFKNYGAEKPWWVDELKKMIKTKGHEKQFSKMLEASTHYFYIWTKQAFESARKSPVLEGFQYLQLSDTERYENANGLIDCFDDPKDIPPEKVLQFNDSTVLVADLSRRTFHEEENITIPIFLSHYSTETFSDGSLSWSIKSKRGDAVYIEGRMDDFDLSWRGLRQICRIEITLPALSQAEALLFSCELTDGEQLISNQWDLWLFPNRPERIEPIEATIALKNIRLNKRYLQIVHTGDLENTSPLLITDKFSENVIKHLERGKDALVLYRIDENRDRKAPRETYYLPSTRDRFKGVIWDRGHNCGGFMREHPIMDEFPHDGLIDWQFYNLIQDSDKIDLDDFPVPVEPIIEGVDKAVRDRYDVGRFDLPDFVYEYTMRKFSYMFELRVGDGRLIVSGMNFRGIEKDTPEVCWLFECLLRYMKSEEFIPKQSISADALRNYLIEKGKSKRIKERMMTQYWQIDKDPLESKSYWIESEAWLRQEN